MTRPDAEPSLSEALRDLKREGSALLVVGNAPDTVHRRTCEGMFGGSSDHRRIALRTDGSCLDPATAEAGDTRLLRWAAAARGAVGAAGPGVPAAGPGPASGSAATDHDSLQSLTRATFDAVDAARPEAGPGDLRLGIDSLVPLLGCGDESAVFRFLHAVLGDVREADGIAHAHLPAPRDHRSVHTVEPLFDATVELGVRDGVARQRWHVADPPLSSEWIRLDDALPE